MKGWRVSVLSYFQISNLLACGPLLDVGSLLVLDTSIFPIACLMLDRPPAPVHHATTLCPYPHDQSLRPSERP